MFKENKKKYGFIYIWLDRKYNRYYVGCHWGAEDDGYVCSSSWLKQAYNHRPLDFKRRIIKTNIKNRDEMFAEEYRWLQMIKPEEIKPYNSNPRYYNLKINKDNPWHQYPENVKTIGQKISYIKTGVSTGPCSEETKEKIRQATKGVKKTYTEESYQRLINTSLGRKHTQKWKDNNSEMLKEQWSSGVRKPLEKQSEESNKKRSEKLKGRQITIPTDETRAKQTKARKALWADPAYREKMTAIRRDRKKKIV